MSRRSRGRKRRSPFDIFGLFDEIFERMESMFEEFPDMETMGGGYSISVTYDETGRPIVRVQTYGNVDKEALRREIKNKYPDAKIIGLDEESTEPSLIREIAKEESRIPAIKEEESQSSFIIREVKEKEDSSKKRKRVRIKVE
ncbi:MAG: hypothetical protein ACTSXJ_07925 [Candidatus Baldrarchaeia archaeon]